MKEVGGGNWPWKRVLFGLGLLLALLVIARLLYAVRPTIYGSSGAAPSWPILLAGYFLGLVPALWFSLLFRKSSNLEPWEPPALFLPFVLWLLLSGHVGPGMSLANMFLEPIYLALVVSSIHSIRLLVRGQMTHAR